MLTLLLGLAAAAPTHYTLNPDHSRLYVVVYNDTSAFMSRMAHDHAIQALRFQASVDWDPDDLAACAISFELPVSGLWPDPPGARAHAGIDVSDTIGEGSKRSLVNNMLGKSQLWSSRFSTIRYRSSGCSANGQRIDVQGVLTIRGQDKALTVPMSVSADGSSFSASGSFELSYGDFGFAPFSNLAGALRYQDRLRFVVEVSGQAAPRVEP